MTASLAATLFYFYVTPWIAVAVMWSVLPKLSEPATDTDPCPATVSGHTFARAFTPVRERR